jgi:hypothetical protein
MIARVVKKSYRKVEEVKKGRKKGQSHSISKKEWLNRLKF